MKTDGRRTEDRENSIDLARMGALLQNISTTLSEHLHEDKVTQALILDRLGQMEVRISKWHGGVVATGVIVSTIWAAIGIVMMILTWRFPVGG